MYLSNKICREKWQSLDLFVQAPLVIHNPHALPLFREERVNKRHLDGRSKDAHERTKPDLGTTALKGTGTGGEIGSTGGTLLTQFVLKNQVGFSFFSTPFWPLSLPFLCINFLHTSPLLSLALLLLIQFNWWLFTCFSRNFPWEVRIVSIDHYLVVILMGITYHQKITWRKSMIPWIMLIIASMTQS